MCHPAHHFPTVIALVGYVPLLQHPAQISCHLLHLLCHPLQLNRHLLQGLERNVIKSFKIHAIK